MLNFDTYTLIFWYCQITENAWKNQGFLKTDHGLLCTPDLVYCFFELVSYSFQKEKASNIWIQEELGGFEFQYKSLNFLPSCQDYPWCNYGRELLYFVQHPLSKHLS